MAYSELIKNFERIRGYMRQFYVYGFKHRSEYDAKSARSYDNERRRIESWLQEYMSFRKDESGKRMFLSVDSRAIVQNPLFEAFKAKSFTDGDITFHFYLMDILADGEALSVREIVSRMDALCLHHFEDARLPDDSTVRKKLKEYAALGLLTAEKRGKELCYRLSEDGIDLESWQAALQFYSEVDPLGVVGSFLLDRLPGQERLFGFKHHYILHTLDSQILYELLGAIGAHRRVEAVICGSRGKEKQYVLYPLKIYISTQSGRQYLLAYCQNSLHPMFVRLDNIHAVTVKEPEPDPARYQAAYQTLLPHLWGVSGGSGRGYDRIEMVLQVEKGEDYIIDRLLREKRCGTVTQLDDTHWQFTAEVPDAAELRPWIRTFTGRITSLQCSNPEVTEVFYRDLDQMLLLYGGDPDAVS